MRRVTLGVALGAATTVAALAAPPAISQQSFPDYKTLIVKASGKQSVAATLGPYSVPTADGKGESANPSFPLQGTGTIRVKRHEELSLLFRAKAGHVTWRAARINGKGEEVIVAIGEARSVTKTKRRWKMQLPKDLSRTTDVLGFLVEYNNGFASFEVGTKVR